MDKIPTKKEGVEGMILDCIQLWGSTSQDLERVEYTLITITSKSTLTRRGRTC